MQEFPQPIQRAMRAAGAAATCLPVQLDGSSWETALFVHVAGPECRHDRKLLKRANTTVPARLGMELMAHENAAVVMMQLEIHTVTDDPLIFEILLTPGEKTTHHECLRLLASQQRLCWFFADSDFRVIRAQQQEIESEQRELFDRLAREAFAHDSLIRITGRYNAQDALAQIVSHYQPRETPEGAHDGELRKKPKLN